MVALAPEILAVAAALTLTYGIVQEVMPDQLKSVKDKATGWATDVWNKIKSTIADLAKKGSGLFATVDDTGQLGKDAGEGIKQNTEKALEAVKTQMDEWAAAAGKTLLNVLGLPADAIAVKYKDLFDKLEKLLHDKAVTGDFAAAFRKQLQAAEQTELDAKVFEQQKQHVNEVAKLDQERIKGSYEAQIAYIEAFDEQDTKKKVAAIDKVTALRIESVQKVAGVQNEELRIVYEQQKKLIDAHPEQFAGAAEQAAALAELQRKMTDAQALNTQKAEDETQKYRLEGWKKANDAIIEDQKRVYDAFKSEFDEIFDAFTKKDIGKALGDVFKKLALGEAKNVFSSSLASSATELAGYGKPDEPITRSGGILSQLFRRGAIPRPPLAPPKEYQPKGISLEDIKFGVTPTGTEAAKLAQPANLFIAGVDTYNTATQQFAHAVEQFAASGGGAGGGGGGAFIGGGGGGGGATTGLPGVGGAALSTASGVSNYVSGSGRFGSVFQAAARATGVPEQLLRAVSDAESTGNPNIVSPKGAIGLMQLMPGTAKDLGVTDIHDPYQNVMAGSEYLQKLIKKYNGDVPAALRAYNMGPAGYDRALATGAALPTETQNYVGRVLGAFKKLGGTAFAGLAGGAAAAATGLTTPRPDLFEPLNIAQPTPGSPLGDIASIISPPGAGAVGAGGWPAAAGIGLGGGAGAATWPAAVGIGLGGEGGGGTAPVVSEAGGAQGPGFWASNPAAIGLDAITTGAVSRGAFDTKTASGFAKFLGAIGLGNIFSTKGGKGGGPGIFGGGSGSKWGAPGQQGPMSPWQSIQTTFGIGQSSTGGTSFGSVLGSQGVGNIAGIGGGLLLASGLSHHTTLPTVAGGSLLGLKYGKMLGLSPGTSLVAGAGLGLVAAGVQRGGGVGLAEDIGGGALAGGAIGLQFGGPLGAAIGAGIGAAAGAITGVVRLFIKTEQEKIRAQIKQVYGIDISNRQILTQIQQIVDQKYGGNVAVGIHSQDVQDIVRLYALSSGQVGSLPRQMYNATIAQSTQGIQLQPTYNGGVQVQNPYTGTTSYQYAHAAITAQGANPSPGSGLGVPGASGLINNQFQQLTLQTIQGNPSAIAMASSAAATAGDSRLSTAAAMQEPLTALS
jgi:hypothetical protein